MESRQNGALLKKNDMNKQIQNKQPKIDASVRALFSLYWQNKAWFITFDLTRMTSAAIGAFLPLFLAKIINSKGDIDYLYFIVPIAIIAMYLHHLLWSMADYIFSLKILKIFYKFREIMFKATWNREYIDFVSKSTGKTASTITSIHSYLGTLTYAYNWNFLVLLVSIPVLFGLLANVIIENSIAYILFIVLVLIVLKLQIKTLKVYQRKYADLNTTAEGHIYDSFANFVNVFAFGARKKEIMSFEKSNTALSNANSKSETRMMTFWMSAGLLLRGLLWSVILMFNLYLYKHKEILFEQFILSVTVLVEFTSRFWSLVEAYGNFTENFSKYKENYNFIFKGRNVVKEHKIISESINVDVARPEFNQSIDFNNLNFAYPDRKDKLVLKNINLNIKHGEKIGVVGKSGSGKSTLVKVLLGFYDFELGSITVDGQTISKEEIALLNCYVPQDTTLFEQSIEFNIAYAKNTEVSHEEVVEAAKKAHAHEFIMSLKHAYDTLVGERGIKLSLGQRQRIALARAFLKDSQLLILDEATSSLDSKTESLVQESLEELWKNRTVLAVAHRLSTLNNVDRIIVMDDGRIIEHGTKSELLAMNGMFADLWNHQANGMIIEDDEDEVDEDEI